MISTSCRSSCKLQLVAYGSSSLNFCANVTAAHVANQKHDSTILEVLHHEKFSSKATEMSSQNNRDLRYFHSLSDEHDGSSQTFVKVASSKALNGRNRIFFSIEENSSTTNRLRILFKDVPRIFNKATFS